MARVCLVGGEVPIEEVADGLWEFLGEEVVVVKVAHGVEGVVPLGEHLCSKVVGDADGHDPEVADHGIGAPAADELDGAGVDFGAEESSCSPRTEAVRCDFVCGDASQVFDTSGSPAQSVGDFRCGDSAAFSIGGCVGVERGIRRVVVFTQVGDAALAGTDRAELGVAAAAMSYCFASHSILLVSEFETHATDGWVIHVIQRGCERRDDTFDSSRAGVVGGQEADVLHAEGGASAFGTGGLSVFPWSA